MQYGRHARLTRKTLPANDAVWHLFVCNGPHGKKFEWARSVPGVGNDLHGLREFIDERSSAIPDFETHARTIAIESLESDKLSLVLTGIQVLAVVGSNEDMLLLKPLANSDNSEIAKHARAALFERGIKIKNREG